MRSETHIVRPDAKGRITLGKLAKGVSSFRVSKHKDGWLLKPYVEVPALSEKEIMKLPERERWLYRNPQALAMVLQGIESAKAGKLHYRGSFAKYADDNPDDEE